MLTESVITGVGVGAAVAIPIIGVYVWVSCHIANRRRHPDAEKVIYEDFCSKSQEGIAQRHKDTEKRIDDRHKVSEDRADERHEELKKLIVANGKRT